jgi:hypothetical protein
MMLALRSLWAVVERLGAALELQLSAGAHIPSSDALKLWLQSGRIHSPTRPARYMLYSLPS